MKLLSKLNLIFLIFIILFFGCDQKIPEENISKPIFDGIYKVEFDDWDVTYLWIFADNKCYQVSPGINTKYLNPNKDVDYSNPIYFKNDKEKLYYGSPVSELKPIPLSERTYYPVYNIKNIDTIDDGLKLQIIELEEVNNQRFIKISKVLN